MCQDKPKAPHTYRGGPHSKRNTVYLSPKVSDGMSYEESWDEIDELLDRVGHVEDRPVPAMLMRPIGQLAQRMYETGRYTELRAKELAVSAIYLSAHHRPSKSLPCHPKQPSMLCCRPELQIETRLSGVAACESISRRKNARNQTARHIAGIKLEVVR